MTQVRNNNHNNNKKKQQPQQQQQPQQSIRNNNRNSKIRKNANKELRQQDAPRDRAMLMEHQRS